MSTNGDWYCRSCGFLPATRVTHSETCDTCHQPVEWHDTKKQSLIMEMEAKLSAARAEARELKTRLFHAERQRDVASGGLQAEARQSDEQRERACAAEREARELREGLDDSADKLLQAAKKIEGLRAELARVRGLLDVARCPSCDGSGTIPRGPTPDGYWELEQCQWCDERGPLSQPAEQPAPPDSDLPLIARRNLPEWATHCYECKTGDGELIPVIPEPWLAGALNKEWGRQLYRIADTDEHGLPVIERTAEMPEGAKYRVRYDGKHAKGAWEYRAELDPKHELEVWQRIEDYNAHAEPAQREGWSPPREQDINDSVRYFGGKWPRKLTGGVLFFQGSRITREDFERAAQREGS